MGIVTRVTTRGKREWLKRERCILNSSSAQNKITLGWGSLVMCRREETSGPVKEGKSSKKYDFDNKSIGLAGLVTI